MKFDLSFITSSLGMGIWQLSPNDQSIQWDDRLYAMYGLAPDTEITSEVWANFIDQNDLDIMSSHFPLLLNGTVETFDFNFKLKNEEKWIRTIARLVVDDDGEEFVVGVNFDITSQIQQEYKLHKAWKEREETINRLTLALKVTNIGIWDWDITSDELHWDEQMYQLYQLDKDSFDKTTVAWQKSIHPEDLKKVKRELINAVQDLAPLDTEFRVIYPNEEVHWIKAKAQIFKDSDGKAIRMLGANIDITDFKTSEEEIKRQEKINMHQSKLASIGELAAGVGHEINNPLTIAKGSLIIASKKLKKYEDDLLDKLAAQLDKGVNAVKRIEDIASGLRNFSRSEEDHISKTDVLDSIKQVNQFINELYHRAGISIDLDFPEGPIFINGNSSRLQQVFMNFFANAKDALENRPQSKIKVSAFMDHDTVKIRFSDNGEGIPKNIQNKIFENFFTTKKLGKGTGIGLALSSRIIAEHNGQIELDSEVGKGTTFTLSFPVYSQKLDEVSNQVNPLKILVVDDEEDIRELLCEIFTDRGYQVTEAQNGQVAFDLMQNQKFDFVFSDIRMPTMDGVTLFRNAKKEPYTPVLVAVSGCIDYTTYASSELNTLANAAIKKPIDIDKIENIIDKYAS